MFLLMTLDIATCTSEEIHHHSTLETLAGDPFLVCLGPMILSEPSWDRLESLKEVFTDQYF